MKKLIPTLIAAVFAFAACGKEKPSGPIGPQVTPFLSKAPLPVYQKKEEPLYVYKGDRFRDPFISLVGSGASFGESEDSGAPNISNLTLKGIISEGSVKMALISGGGSTYVLKDSRLYDNRQRVIKGITGAIKTESVIIIMPDRTVKELKLREKDKY